MGPPRRQGWAAVLREKREQSWTESTPESDIELSLTPRLDVKDYIVDDPNAFSQSPANILTEGRTDISLERASLPQSHVPTSQPTRPIFHTRIARGQRKGRC